MRLIDLEFGNFKAFRGEGHRFNFAGGVPGLHIVEAINNDCPGMGANGVGKTTLWEVVFWVLYGCTTRGQRGASVRTWFSKGRCYGRLFFDTGYATHTIEREVKSPMILLLDGKPVEQDAIDKLIGLTDELFKHAIMQPQFGEFFLDLRPAPKLALFTTLLDLDRWSGWSTLASKKAAELEREVAVLATALATADTTEKLNHDQLVELNELQTEWTRTRAGDRRRLSADLADARDTLRRAQEAFDKQLVVINQANDRVKDAAEALAGHDRQSRALRDATVTARVARDRAELALQDAEKALAAFRKSPETCQTCGQRLSDRLRRDEGDRLADDARAAKHSLDELKDAVNDATRSSDDDDRLRNQLVKEERDERSIAEEERAAMNDADQALRSAQGELRDLERRNTELANDQSPYAEQIGRAKRALETAKRSYDEAERRLNATKSELVAVAYWPTGFRDIRLELIEAALGSFEVECNNQLADLAMPGWSIGVDIEKDTKAGGTMKGFTVTVASPKSVDPVAWESWSGGETQRLRLAGKMGFSSLIMRRLGVEAGIMVIDEPSEHLSPEGMADLMTLLAERARERSMQIWIIDHRAVQSADVTSVTTIVNDSDGARIGLPGRTSKPKDLPWTETPPGKVKRRKLVE